MERLVIPISFIGGFIVGKNRDKIAKVCRPYVGKGIKNTRKIIAQGLRVIQKTTPKIVRGTVSFFRTQGERVGKKVKKVPSLVKESHQSAMVKATSKKRKVKISRAAAG